MVRVVVEEGNLLHPGRDRQIEDVRPGGVSPPAPPTQLLRGVLGIVDSFAGFFPLSAIFTAISATALTIQSKFSCPTDVISASGAGFRKSIA